MIHFIGNTDLQEDYSAFKVSTIDECIEYFTQQPSIAVDTETLGLDPHTDKIISLQLGNKERQYVIDCRSHDILQFKTLLQSKKLLLQNAKFDYKVLKHVGIVIEDIWDTMLAECVLYCGYDSWGYGLAKLVHRYTGLEMDKTVRAEFMGITDQPFTPIQIQYAGLDVAYLHDIATQQHEKLIEYDLMYAFDLECQVVKALGDIEYNGMFLDREAWSANTTIFQKTLDTLLLKLDNIVEKDGVLEYPISSFGVGLFGETIRKYKINYNSHKQVKELIHKLSIDVPNTNAKTLVKVADKHEFISTLMRYKEAAKVISTYGDSFLNNINTTTGRIHSDFWEVLNTYRVSSSSPNLQNIPAVNTFRNCFKPRPGYKWGSIDYQSQELRIMADVSKEDGFIDILNKDEDLHCYVGSLMFKKPITKQDVELRTQAKTINFGKP